MTVVVPMRSLLRLGFRHRPRLILPQVPLPTEISYPRCGNLTPDHPVRRKNSHRRAFCEAKQALVPGVVGIHGQVDACDSTEVFGEKCGVRSEGVLQQPCSASDVERHDETDEEPDGDKCAGSLEELLAPPLELPDSWMSNHNDLRLSSIEKVPEHLQEVINAHVAFIQRHHEVHQGTAMAKNRNWVRHHKIDSRKDKRAKRNLLQGYHRLCEMTPYMLMGAFQTLIKRAAATPETPAHASILKHSINVPWFLDTAEKILQGKGVPFDLRMRKTGTEGHCKLLVIQEALAMVMRPKLLHHRLQNYMPPHAWSELLLDGTQNRDPNKILLDLIIEYLEHHSKDLKPGSVEPLVMMWDLANMVKKRKKPTLGQLDKPPSAQFRLSILQFKMIKNMVQPYVQTWWHVTLGQIFNIYSKGTNVNKKRYWPLLTKPSEDDHRYYPDTLSSLPALLVDMLLLRLDQNEQLMKYMQKQVMVKKRNTLSSSESDFPTEVKISKSLDDLHHLRVGPAFAVIQGGPSKTHEKTRKMIEQQLKSDLQFDKKHVDNQALILNEKSGAFLHNAKKGKKKDSRRLKQKEMDSGQKRREQTQSEL